MQAAPRHTCPICGREAAPPARSRGTAEPGEPTSALQGNPSFPFCSPACKLVDLGRWLEGSYRIPEPSAESSLDGGDE